MKNKTKIWLIVILIVTALCGGIVFDACKLAPKRLKVRYETITSAKIGEDISGMSLLFFSDLNYGKHTDKARMEKTVSLINKQQADIVIFLGDLFAEDAWMTKAEEILPLLRQIQAPYGKFALLGVQDSQSEEKADLIRNIWKQAGFEVLENKALSISTAKKSTIRFVAFGTEADLSLLDTDENADRFVLCACHIPSVAEKLYEKDFDLFLSGYTLGGQINLPLFGSLLDMPYADTFYKGKHEINKGILDINQGIGTLEKDMRLFAEAEITVWRLYHK